MTLKPYKVVLAVFALEYDDEGNIVGERRSEELVLYGMDQLREWVEGFENEHFPENGRVEIEEPR